MTAIKGRQSAELAQFLARLSLELRLSHLIKQHRITHCLFTWIPWGQPIPRLRIPIVAVVHDRNWRRFPENFRRYNPDDLDRNLRKWVTSCAGIVTPSRAVQRELNELCPEFGSRIKVVPEAATVVEPPSGHSVESIDESDPTPIFYYPGTAGAHKGHLTLFRAAHRLASRGHKFKLVLTGKDTRLLTGFEPAAIPQVEQCRTYYHANRAVLQPCISVLDFCDPQRVEQLYRRSTRVVLPSQYEGFGLPLIEAVSRGCRVICSDIEPYQEQIELYQCADYAQVYRVDNDEALASLMEQAMVIPSHRRLSADEARSIAQRWTWRDATMAIVLILEEGAT